MTPLEIAAERYGRIRSQMDSAVSCCVSADLFEVLCRDANDALQDLKSESIKFFHDTYDGDME